ncbi:MAG: hypothetical protein Q9227_008008 [Pyrenula ochraceoflavens]
MDDSGSALEQFRKQWREEVSARSRRNKGSWNKEYSESTSASERPKKPPLPTRRPPTAQSATALREGEEFSEDDVLEDGVRSQLSSVKLDDTAPDDDGFKRSAPIEPQSALEHFEKAVEKEAQGKLGDSVSHYRKAYRLDARVDKAYKDKHFPAPTKPTATRSSIPPIDSRPTADASSKKPKILDPTFSELIESCSGSSIPQAEPIIAGDKPPPCPIALLPNELLYEILRQCGIRDPASFVRLSLVCRRLAYLVITERSIWKRIALGPEFGIASQHYDFARDVTGGPLIYRTLEESTQPDIANALTEAEDQNWKEMFHTHPRIRFSGIYISTVNYTRAGGASATQATWNTPVHIVTYYRYLRFFRDGTVISLLSLHEPLDVVHHLTPENMPSAGKDKKGPQPSLPSSDQSSAASAATVNHSVQNIMKNALRGRWRLCHPLSAASQSTKEIATSGAGAEGDLHIETEGHGPRYLFTMHLALKSTTRSRTGVKNNKLVWKGLWSYNQLTSDWGEFSLKNDKPFLFARVKSYGLGYWASCNDV